MDYKTEKIRNIALLGHQGSGKTSLIEALNLMTKAIPAKGLIEKGTTISDYLPYEAEKGGSFNTTVCPVYYKDYKLNFIDVPGSEELAYEMDNALNVVEGAILLIDASSGVQVGTKNAYRTITEKHVPCLIFVNKMEKENVHFDNVLKEIKEQLGSHATVFAYPLGHENDFNGFINVVDMKARLFNGKEVVDGEVNADKKDHMQELHDQVVELVAETSEELLDKFFGGEEITNEEIHNGLRQAVAAGDVEPILVGSVQNNIGILSLLDTAIDYLPSPADVKPRKAKDENGKEIEVKADDTGAFSAYVFKTIVDPFLGTINFFKTYSGLATPGMDIVVNGQNPMKVKDLLVMNGKKQNAVEKLSAGDIGAITKLTGINTGDTISAPKNVVIFEPTPVPNPTQYLGIVAASKNDDDKLSGVLQKVMLEDPSIQLQRNVETSQLLIGGQGLHHLNFVLDKIKRIYKVNLNTEDQKIVYRETIRGKAEALGSYKKQSGGAGFFGVVNMRFEPSKDGSSFSEEIFGGAVPKNYFPAVEKGFYEALEKGPLAGYPVINVHATLFDGKYHDVDSNELSFKMAAKLSFKEAYPKCNPVLLEPIMKVMITVADEYLGDVMSDINQRRGRIANMGSNGSMQVIEAYIPEAEIITYKMDLSSLTQGNGKFSREFYQYEVVPFNIQEKIVKERAAEKQQD